MTTTATSIQIGKSTSVHVIVDQREKDPLQMDCFAATREYWIAEMMEVALSMQTPFWFSQLRKAAKNEPPSSSWWGGQLTHHMKKAGFRQTGSYKKHTRESRKSGLDFEWTRTQTES